MTAPGDETDETGAEVVAPEGKSGRIARAKARAEAAKIAGAEILEREQARRKSVWVAVEAYSRDRRFAGGLLAGGLAFRLFLWLLPFSLVTVTLFGGLADSLEQPASELAHDAGLSAALAGSVATAVKSSAEGRFYLLALGVVLLIWAGMGVVKAMRLISGLAWETPPKTTPHNPFLESALVVAVVVAALGAHLVTIRLGASFASGGVLVFMAESSVLAGLMIWVFWNLPHTVNAGWTAMIPGAILVAAGIAVVRLITVVYFADRLDSIGDLYGALGVASVFLAWLYIIGRLLVAGISLNASGFNASTNPPVRRS
jgi:uncharacterized BrkB/YihY/UPF0761 family membrane protein